MIHGQSQITVPSIESRLAARGRPPGSPIMDQSWQDIVFLHWPMDPALIRRAVPEPLAIDLFDGRAWIAITPFTVTGLRPHGGPAIPGISTFHEVNVRTYVHMDGVPGVWFISLDAGKVIPTLAARWLLGLNYVKAEMARERFGETFRYQHRRSDPSRPPGGLDVSWRVGPELPAAEAGSLEFFLIERYVLYSVHDDTLQRMRIYHVPWFLRAATALELNSTLIAAANLPEPVGPPLAHFSVEQPVEVWAPEPLTRCLPTNYRAAA